ncbi:tetratricopeptide repeat protein [Litchfieldia alkalitelluris]|uniref:tetratricopeptide repeat protein n=1 Tax=Litchfieldia alkalitelluris TaxID=304268 RepID=UPI001F3907A4|nr:tetratricopeptide repeat protein [Litchfieldia alkalitelluris]
MTNENHLKAIQNLINGTVDHVVLDDEYYNPTSTLINLEKQLSETKFKLGMEYWKNGKKEEALHELDEALLLDTDNFLIRKQRWYIRYPEKFSPTIDIEWQQIELKKEKAVEAKLKNDLDCGPEGCYIPGTTNNSNN